MWGTRCVECYDVDGQIGEGTYGKVYKATNRFLSVGDEHRVVALKKITIPKAHEGLPKTVFREIKGSPIAGEMLRQITHQYLVPLLEIVTSKLSDDDRDGDQAWSTSNDAAGSSSSSSSAGSSSSSGTCFFRVPCSVVLFV